MRPSLLGLRTALVAVVAVASTAAPVGAQVDVSIDFDDLVFGSPGSVRQVAQVDVDADLVGRTCLLAIHAENQASVHKGNDLIVSTGAAQAVIVGVEDTPNGGTEQIYDMVLGPEITVQLRIGHDGMSSLGFGLTFDCSAPLSGNPPPTLGQQVTETTTTTAPTTTAPPPTVAPTTSAAPTTAAPTTAPPTTPTTVVSTTTTSAPPVVAGQATDGLPETPAADAVAGAPAYTG